jgi:hypothetical protein
MNWLKSFWKSLNIPVAPAGQHFDESLNNFTPCAQKVLALARDEAQRFRHNFIGTEHLLLGLITLGQGTAVTVLNQMGIDLKNVRQEVEKQVGSGPDNRVAHQVPYAPRVKKVLALAAKESKALNHTYVGTEHILLGLLHEGDGVAARVLKSLGIDTEVTRQHILRELDPSRSFHADTAEMRPKTEAVTATREPLDLRKRYDIYCCEGDQQVVYPNVLFKGVKTLFPRREWDFSVEYLEIEQSDGRTIFVNRMSIVKFCEHGNTANSESSPAGSA